MALFPKTPVCKKQNRYPDKTLPDFLQPLGYRLTTLAVTQKSPSSGPHPLQT